MIIVIADDFTGAAEMAGVALKYGLKTEVLTSTSIDRNMDVSIIDTNTRSKSSEKAKKKIDSTLFSLELDEYDMIFKKTDSVFRGHVYDELSVLINHFSDKSILLAPANPSRGRTIYNGEYFIDGRLLHETIFSGDPEAPAHVSDIYLLMGANKKNDVHILKPGDSIPEASGKIFIAESGSVPDVKNWVHKLNDGIIPAGAADFFDAILSGSGYQVKENADNVNERFGFNSNSLFICGSSLSRVVNLEQELFSKNPKVVEVSEDQICLDGLTGVIEKIAKAVIGQFDTTDNVILFVNASDTKDEFPTRNIPKCLASITSMVLDEIEIGEIFIEGGTTSSEVVRKIGWDRFNPVHQLGQGIVRMQVLNKTENYITVKPGSYKWPDNLWNEKLMDQKKP